MVSTQEVQMDFADFVKQVADTYRKLSKVIIADVLSARGTYEEQIDIISKLYNVDFKKATKYLDDWKDKIEQLPIL
jgi:ABC-type Fe3+-hydroxamate transport system substrate-binding protein